MERGQERCVACGRPARVRILKGYAAGQSVIRPYCLDCADRQWADVSTQAIPSVHRVSLGSLIVVAGLTMAAIGLTGDYLGIPGNHGFGSYKLTGLVAGGFLICVGAFLRADILAVAGTVTFALAISANILGQIGGSGFGWKHQLAIGTGLVLASIGLLVRHHHYRRAAAVVRRASPPSP